MFVLPNQAQEGLMPAFNTEHDAQTLMRVGCTTVKLLSLIRPLTLC